MIGGSFWGRIIGFAKGLFSKAAPHINNFITRAQRHVKKAASKAIETAIDSAVSTVAEKLAEKANRTQAGDGKDYPKMLKKPN